MKELVGETVKEVWINDDSTAMVFKTESGKELCYYTWGDCCSESWFSSVTGFGNLIGREVKNVTERVEITGLPSERQEEDKLYGYLIEVPNPNYSFYFPDYCEIEFRNASNGYYGGECVFMNDEDYKEERGPYTQLKDDFPGQWKNRYYGDDEDEVQ